MLSAHREHPSFRRFVAGKLFNNWLGATEVPFRKYDYRAAWLTWPVRESNETPVMWAAAPVVTLNPAVFKY
jgi:hypothetical protein